MKRRADVVMITYRSAGYLHLSLPLLLDSLGENDRVWLWHNGDDEATLEALRPYTSDPRVARFHHSRENVRLHEPTNWLWQESDAEFVSKVDDDCLISTEWLDTFAAAHRDIPDLGVVGSWRHWPEEFRPDLAERKIQTFPGGHRLMRNPWVQGSGHLLRRQMAVKAGYLRAGESFTEFCLRLAMEGAVIGFYYPFIREDHMDDPRSPHSLITTDADLADRLPLSAQRNGIRTVEEWIAQLERSAVVLQGAPYAPKHYHGWRPKVRHARQRIGKALGLRVVPW